MAQYDLPELRPRPEESDKTLTGLQNYYKQLNYWCDSAEEEGKSLQQDVPELREIENALDYLVGLQWKEAMPSYRAKPVSNEFLTMFWEAVGLLTDIRPIFHVVDLSSGGKYSAHQKVLNGLAKGWSRTTRFERTFAFCVMFGMLTSAPCKIYWDPFARGTSGDPWEGDIAMECISPRATASLGRWQQ